MTNLEQRIWATTFANTMSHWGGKADGDKVISLAIHDADEAVLALRLYTEGHGRLHEDDDLEAERRADLDLPEVEPMCEWCGDPVNNGRTHGEGYCFDGPTYRVYQEAAKAEAASQEEGWPEGANIDADDPDLELGRKD